MKLFVLSALLSIGVFAATPTYSVDELVASEDALTHKEFVVKIDEGMRLPFKVRASGDLFEVFCESEMTFLAKRGCFLKMGQDALWFSVDGEKWETFEEYSTGLIGMSFEPTDAGPAIVFKADVNKR